MSAGGNAIYEKALQNIEAEDHPHNELSQPVSVCATVKEA